MRAALAALIREQKCSLSLRGVLDLARDALAERVGLVRIRPVVVLERGRVGQTLCLAILRSVHSRVHLLRRLRLGLARDTLAEGVLVVLAGAVRGRESSRVGRALGAARGRGVR